MLAVVIIGNEIIQGTREFLNLLVLVFGTGNFDELGREYRVDFGWGNT